VVQSESGKRSGFFAENCSLKINNDAPAVGRAAIAEVARGFMRDFPDMIVTFDKLEPRGDLTAFYWTLSGTNTGPGGTGNKVRISGYELWRIGNNGLIAESRAISMLMSTNSVKRKRSGISDE
jgi:hypothetical protein